MFKDFSGIETECERNKKENVPGENSSGLSMMQMCYFALKGKKWI